MCCCFSLFDFSIKCLLNRLYRLFLVQKFSHFTFRLVRSNLWNKEVKWNHITNWKLLKYVSAFLSVCVLYILGCLCVCCAVFSYFFGSIFGMVYMPQIILMCQILWELDNIHKTLCTAHMPFYGWSNNAPVSNKKNCRKLNFSMVMSFSYNAFY